MTTETTVSVTEYEAGLICAMIETRQEALANRVGRSVFFTRVDLASPGETPAIELFTPSAEEPADPIEDGWVEYLTLARLWERVRGAARGYDYTESEAHHRRQYQHAVERGAWRIGREELAAGRSLTAAQSRAMTVFSEANAIS